VARVWPNREGVRVRMGIAQPMTDLRAAVADRFELSVGHSRHMHWFRLPRVHLPYGSRRRRLLQALGMLYNDDGSYGPLELKSAKGEAAMAREREEFGPPPSGLPPP